MANYFKDQKKVIYLDQFCTSGMFDDIGSNSWKEIKDLLILGFKKGKLICPISFEHFLESSQRNIKSGIKLNNSFLEISGDYIYKNELLITSQLIISLIRKNNLTPNTFFYFGEKILFNNPENFNKIGESKKEFDIMINNNVEFANEIRKFSRGNKADIETNELLYKATKSITINKFNDRLKETSVNKYIKIRGDKFLDKEIPNWIDSIIYRLLYVHRMNIKETDILIKHIDKFGFDFIAPLNIKTSIRALGAIQQKKEIESDHIDFMRLSTGLSSSDILFTDKRRKNEVITLKLDEKYNCKVFSGIEKDLEEFKAMLQIIIEN